MGQPCKSQEQKEEEHPEYPRSPVFEHTTTEDNRPEQDKQGVE